MNFSTVFCLFIDAQRIYCAVKLLYRFCGILMDFSSENSTLKETLTPSIIMAIHFFLMNSFFAQWTFDNTATDIDVCSPYHLLILLLL